LTNTYQQHKQQCTARCDLKLTVDRIVGTGSFFLIRYSNGHTKYTYRQLKKFLDCL